MQAAASASLCGLDPRSYLACEDPAELAVMDAVVAAAQQRQLDLYEHEAALIAKAVWGDGK